MGPEIRIDDTSYVLSEGITVVGRGEDADLQIESGGLSRMHARFTVRDDSLQIEDLGSKNGVFVNGTRIKETVTLTNTDALKLANLVCEFSLAAAPPPAVPANGRPKADKRSKAHKRSEMGMIKNLIGAACVLIALFGGYRCIAGYVPQELREARTILEAAQPAIESAAITEDLPRNLDLMADLDRFRADLESISPSFAKEYAAAEELLGKIKGLTAALEKQNAIAAHRTKAAEEYNGILAGLDNGSLPPIEAIKRLDLLLATYGDTETADSARRKISSMRSELTSAELAGIAQTATQARELMKALKFKEALDLLERARTKQYHFAQADDLTPLGEISNTVHAAAEKQFGLLAEKAIKEAATGDCAALKNSLRQAYAELAFAVPEEELKRAVRHIEVIREERIEQARTALARELNRIESLEVKRNYSTASAEYAKLLPGISEPELKREVQRKQGRAELMTAAKAAIIALVNRSGGIEVFNVGLVRKATETDIEIALDDSSMTFTWDRIRDDEFGILLRKAVDGQNNARALLAYAAMLIESGRNSADAAKFAGRALKLEAGLKDAYPDIFSQTAALTAAVSRRARKVRTVKAANQAWVPIPGEIPEDLTTLHCIGLRWFIKGDTNKNTSVQVAYRPQGEKKWLPAMPLFRVESEALMERRPPEGTTLYAGSIFSLKPDTLYDVQLTVMDPDSVPIEKIVRRRTWKEPIAPAPKRTVVVAPGATGSKSLSGAASSAQPGDLVLLKSGTYKGPIRFTKSGTANRPIVFRAAERGKAIIEVPSGTKARTVNAAGLKHVYFEGLGIRNGRWAMGVHGSDSLVVRGCHFMAVHSGVVDDSQSRRLFIADNTIEGVQTYPKATVKSEDRAVELSGMGHVVCHNRIHHFRDGIDTRTAWPTCDIDFYRNDISECNDDGIELDYSEHNVRAYENRITNCMMAITFQPSRGGPNYAIRNIMYNIGHEVFKLHLTPVNRGPNPMDGPHRTSGGILLHNTLVKCDVPFRVWSNEGPVHYFYARNNVFIGTPAQSAIEITPTMRYADFDYNAYGGKGISRFARWNGKNYASIKSFYIDTGLEKHGRMFQNVSNLFISTFIFPTDKAKEEDPSKNKPVLAPGSPLADRGQLIPTINENFTGRAPDLGALELGQETPVYGPRSPAPDSRTARRR